MADEQTAEGTSVKEYSIFVPRESDKIYSLMKFSASQNIDFCAWKKARMMRENNSKEYEIADHPVHVAGSEYGRAHREESRRKKYGHQSKKYRAEDQPWLLEVDGQKDKAFKGRREGGFSNNASYYVFSLSSKGFIEALPLKEWYNFQPTGRYHTLSVEEAETEYKNRDRQLDYFSVMVHKRMNDSKAELADEDWNSSAKEQKGKLDMSLLENWSDHSEPTYSDEELDECGRKVTSKRKRRPKNPDVYLDDSEEERNDEEEYSSDSSPETKFNKNRKREANSQEDEGDDYGPVENEDDEENNEEEEGEEENESNSETSDSEEKEVEEGEIVEKKRSFKDRLKEKYEKNVDLSKDDMDLRQALENEGAIHSGNQKPNESLEESEKQNGKKNGDTRECSGSKVPCNSSNGTNSANSSDSFRDASLNIPFSFYSPASCSPDSSLENTVRRYLHRKPMTTTDLLHKLRPRKMGICSDKFVLMLTQILRRINPLKQIIQGKMYLSLE